MKEPVVKIDIAPLGGMKKRIIFEFKNYLQSFILDEEESTQLARQFEEASDSLFSWDGTGGEDC